MRRGDQVRVRASGRTGEVVQVSAEGAVYIWREDLVGTQWAGLNPVPYDREELEACEAKRAA